MVKLKNFNIRFVRILLFGLTMKVIFIVTGDCMSSLTDLKTVKRLNKGRQFWKWHELQSSKNSVINQNMLPDYTGYVSYSQTSAVQCSAVPLV
jgi:hypothetical protein